MVLAYGPLRRTAGIRFVKVLGTGRGNGFQPSPNWGVYAILATWDAREDAQKGIHGGGTYGAFRKRSIEQYTVTLKATRAHGTWDGIEPFETEVEPTGAPRPLGVLTRATIRVSRLFTFWRAVPAVSAMVSGRAPLRFSIGMGMGQHP